ncbi:MAG: MotA/TolQ/ExbB proton channel family protein [Verrucomicrobia bacterium]|nr:MotA/TolQ/ExbB proton channel family protein [Verrucomicrobiota bacterium]
MSEVFQDMGSYLHKGGWMMIPLFVLGLILFTSLLRALLFLAIHAKSDVEEEAAFERRLRYLKVLTSVAPLLGLLGTVAGMLKTFRGLASKGISYTENLIAVGISEALVTTQMGLSIGVIGLTGIMLYRHFHQRYLLHEYKQEAIRLRSIQIGGSE